MLKEEYWLLVNVSMSPCAMFIAACLVSAEGSKDGKNLGKFLGQYGAQRKGETHPPAPAWTANDAVTE